MVKLPWDCECVCECNSPSCGNDPWTLAAAVTGAALSVYGFI